MSFSSRTSAFAEDLLVITLSLLLAALSGVVVGSIVVMVMER